MQKLFFLTLFILNISNILEAQTKKYLALGDSYTIGEAVNETESYPVLLVDFLNQNSQKKWSSPTIIATTGWTTDELMQAIENTHLQGQTFDLVSLLIGVNNQYRKYPIEQYKKEFKMLLETAIEFAGGDVSKVFVISIPDYGVTPFAQDKKTELIAEEIDLYNQINYEITDLMQVKYFDITPISKEAKENIELLAEDKLHPSGKMYSLWINSFKNQVLEMLK